MSVELGKIDGREDAPFRAHAIGKNPEVTVFLWH
jgi:hypothetical protein